MKTCDKCNEPIPRYKKIDGAVRNLSSRRFCLKCSPFGANNRTDFTIVDDDWKVCGWCGVKKPWSDYYKRKKDGRPVSYCNQCNGLRVLERHQQTKRMAIEYKGGKCELCGYARCPASLEFHHLDPKKKDVQISKLYKKKFSLVAKEIDKCALLCSNCHREQHYWERRDVNLYQISLQRSGNDKRIKLSALNDSNRSLSDHRLQTERYKNGKIKRGNKKETCTVCEKELATYQKRFCSTKCCGLAQRTCQRPTKRQLKKDIANMTWVATGKKYGVSDNAVRKWARSYRIL